MSEITGEMENAGLSVNKLELLEKRVPPYALYAKKVAKGILGVIQSLMESERKQSGPC